MLLSFMKTDSIVVGQVIFQQSSGQMLCPPRGNLGLYICKGYCFLKDSAKVPFQVPRFHNITHTRTTHCIKYKNL